MTYSIFAINANELSPSGCSAYTYTQNGFEPYLRAPWYQFSEQVNDDPDTNGNTTPVDASHFTLHLKPGTGCRLSIKMKRYANPPTFALPWDCE